MDIEITFFRGEYYLRNADTGAPLHAPVDEIGKAISIAYELLPYEGGKLIFPNGARMENIHKE